MGIELAIVEPPTRGTMRIDGPVAHLGRMIPQDKPGIGLQARGVADHHGKVFSAHNTFYYINLSGFPTYVHRGRKFSFGLDELMPVCEVFEDDVLRLGDAAVRIVKLVLPPPPPRKRRAKTAKASSKLTFRHVDCLRCDPVTRQEVVRVTAGHDLRIREYTSPHEILRASADWLRDLCCGKLRVDHGLKFDRPDAIAIRACSRPKASWPGLDVPIEEGIADDEATVAQFDEEALAPEVLDAGIAFRFADAKREVVGIGCGILEGISDPDSDAKAGHFLLLQYPPGKTPRRDNVCVVHHLVTNVAQCLAMLEGTRLRKRREFDRWVAHENEMLFHDLLQDFARARKHMGKVRSSLASGAPIADTDINGLDSSLRAAQKRANRGRWASLRAGVGEYERVNILELCQHVVGTIWGESETMKRLTDARVVDLPESSSLLTRLPCNRAAVSSVVHGLAKNADKAVKDTGSMGCRVHVMLDAVERDGLPYGRIRVCDDGVGMTPAALSAVFEGRFTTQSGYHGLGAQIIADHVRWQRGLIEVASRQGTGTVVDVLLPAPEISDKQELNKGTGWLQPYIEAALRRPLKIRHEWEGLLESDSLLRNWYQAAKGDH